MDLEKILQKIIRISFYLLFIIVPLILTPWNYELFEFNKMLTVYALTVIIVGAWLGQMVLQKKIIFKRTPFDLPLLLFLSSQILSSIFSIDHHTSLWGYYSRFHGGLLSTICYLLLYWAFVSNMDKKSSVFCLQSSVFTAALVSLYGILEHYGIDASLWVQDVQNRVFSTLGQPNWLAAWLAVLIPITIAPILNSKFEYRNSKQIQNSNDKNSKLFGFRISDFGFFSLSLLLGLCFFYTKSQSGLLGLAIALIIFWLSLFWLNLKQHFLNFKNLAWSFLIFVFAFLFLFFQVGFNAYPQVASLARKLGYGRNSLPSAETTTPGKATASVLEVGGSASGEIRRIVWQGAIEIWKHYPLFGSGVETFAYSYYNYRPLEHNLVSEWDFLYNKAHNEYLNFLATTGLVGLGTYLFFIGSFIVWFSRIITNCMRITLIPAKKTLTSEIRDNSLKFATDSRGKPNLELQSNGVLLTGLFTGWVSILITNFFGFSVVPVALFFFLIPAFCFVLYKEESPPISNILPAGRQDQYPISNLQKILLFLILISTVYLLFSVSHLWLADYHYAMADKLSRGNRSDLAFSHLLSAINFNKNEPVYRNEMAEVASNLALYSFQQKDATAASRLAQIALSQSDKALETTPVNLNFWKSRVKVLYNLSLLNKDFQPAVIEAIKTASKLAPTDPKLVYNLGLLQTTFNQKDLAITAFQQAIKLKPNYQDARYMLALLLKEKGQKEKAKEQLNYILEKIAPGDSPSAKLLKEINTNKPMNE